MLLAMPARLRREGAGLLRIREVKRLRLAAMED